MKITVPVTATTLLAAIWANADEVASDYREATLFRVQIENLDANAIYIDWSGITATTANGYRLDQNDKIEFQITELAQISLIAGTEATDVRVLITT